MKLLKQFDTWEYNAWSTSVNSRMPWLGQKTGILTTSESSDYSWWGTIISDNLQYNPAPWIAPAMRHPGVIWYWVNEDDCSPDRKPGLLTFDLQFLHQWQFNRIAMNKNLYNTEESRKLFAFLK